MAERSFVSREGRDTPRGPFEGVPPHLRDPLVRWVLKAAKYREDNGTLSPIQMALLDARIEIRDSDEFDSDIADLALSHLAAKQEEAFLDLIHALLQTSLDDSIERDLEARLKAGGSAWSQQDGGLVRRLDQATQQGFNRVTIDPDNASSELREAWGQSYGRNTNPSDAWDHAIKAVESILCPIVIPNVAKPTLGQVLGQLHGNNGSNHHLWKLGMPGPGDQYSIEPLIHMLRLIWPNPDRHGHPTQQRTPTLTEARGVTHLAVTVVQWARDGQISRR
jgi:hypothetical protein